MIIKNAVLLSCILILLNACKKEVTIKEEYNPPQPEIYGTWRMIANNSTDTVYYVFTNDGANILQYLQVDTVGFRTIRGVAYWASKNQVYYSNTLWNYKITSDTLSLSEITTINLKFVRVKNPGFTPENWLSDISVISKFTLPKNFTDPPTFGIDGPILYLSRYNDNVSKYYVYKYNIVSKKYEDSVEVLGLASTYFISPNIYYSYGSNNFYLHKSNGLHSALTPISSAFVNSSKNISVNKLTGDIYAYSYWNELKSGKEGDFFNTIYDFSGRGCSNVVYFKDDEFLCLRGNNISRMKINGSLKVVASYDFIVNYGFYSLSTNGDDIYVFAYNYVENKFELLKVKLN